MVSPVKVTADSDTPLGPSAGEDGIKTTPTVVITAPAVSSPDPVPEKLSLN